MRLFLVLLILGVAARLLPHPANFTPVAALALFGGYYFSKRQAVLLPLLTVFIADIFLGGYYGPTMFYVYGSYLLFILIGQLVKGRRLLTLAPATLASSLLFFIITNFGVWADPLFYYPRTLTGLLECYTAALPFFRNTILGDLFFTTALFGAYELGHRFYGRRATVKVAAGAPNRTDRQV